jgi:hypothetical protein
MQIPVRFRWEPGDNVGPPSRNIRADDITDKIARLFGRGVFGGTHADDCPLSGALVPKFRPTAKSRDAYAAEIHEIPFRR